MEKRWKLLPTHTDQTNALQQALKVHPAICRLLVQRHADSFDKAKAYFRPSLTGLHDPFLMKDMGKAVVRLLQAFDQGEFLQ